jgi:uncharacterized membrane protein YphA (DoxX/SURF4 family)
MGNSADTTDKRTVKISWWRLSRLSSLSNVLFSIWCYRLIRVGLAAVFLWAGVAKLSDPQSFALVIGAYGLIPESLIMPVAVGLPALEVIAAIGLLFDIRGSLTIIAGLLVMFMGILSYGIWLGLDIDCGCFGAGDPEGQPHHGLRSAIYKDLLMMAGVAYLYLWRYRRSKRPVRLFEYLPFFKRVVNITR